MSKTNESSKHTHFWMGEYCALCGKSKPSKKIAIRSNA